MNRSALELTMQGKGIDGALAAAKELAEEQCDQKSDPPNYSVTGEFSPGALVIGGEPFDVGMDGAYPTAPPDHPGASLGMPSSGGDFKLMKNVIFEAGACQSLADARWKRLWNHRLAYSGLFVDATDVSGFGTEHTLSPKSDPPDYSVAGESTLGLLSSGGNL